MISTFIKQGKITDLWKMEPQALLSLIRLAANWELEELVHQCEGILVKYLSRENLFGLLPQANQEGWPILKQGCIDYINGWG